MDRDIMFDELHIRLSARRGLSEPVYQGIRRTLAKPSFRQSILRAIKKVCQRYRSLREVRATAVR